MRCGSFFISCALLIIRFASYMHTRLYTKCNRLFLSSSLFLFFAPVACTFYFMGFAYWTIAHATQIHYFSFMIEFCTITSFICLFPLPFASSVCCIVVLSQNCMLMCWCKCYKLPFDWLNVNLNWIDLTSARGEKASKKHDSQRWKHQTSRTKDEK